MYSLKNIINHWEDIKGNPPEFSIHQRIFHSLVMVFIGTAFIGFLSALIFQSLSVALVLLTLVILQIPILYFSRFRNQFRICYVIWILLNHTFAIISFFTQGGFNISVWNFFIAIFFATSLISKKKYYIAWYSLHYGIFFILLFIEYNHPHLISFTSYSKDIFYLKILYSSIFTSAVIHCYINFIIVNYTNKRKKLECQRAESELKGERLRELNEQKNRVISVISHDFNTPLNNIKRYLSLMQKVELDNEQRKLLENELLLVTIDTQNLLANLLAWSRNNMEGIEFSPEVVNINDAIVCTKDLYRDIAKEKNILLEYEISNDVHVMGNYEMIDIIIRNFISNAIKFTAEGGKVIVSAKREENRYKLVVADNGTGFSESQLQGLFVSTIESTPGTRQEKGTGIGLSIAKEFVEMMNGIIGFTSKPGQGTEFYIYLPAVDYQEEADDESSDMP